MGFIEDDSAKKERKIFTRKIQQKKKEKFLQEKILIKLNLKKKMILQI